eukprot:scaffold22137_cov164-Amphora_coffeaeformis.AAC.1
MDENDNIKDRKNESPSSGYNNTFFFEHMARMPWPYLIVLPVVFAILLGLGWSEEDNVEKEVSNLWIPTSGSYGQDRDYAKSIGLDDLGTSAFAALAIARDGGNMLTAERLALVRDRMEQTEKTQIEYKGVTYTWDDFCGITSAPYRFPCLRLSPMDLFLESRWTFELMDKVAWYRGIVQDTLVAPRLTRFGGLTTTCKDPCQDVVNYRFSTGNPLALFADVGNLEYNDVCKMCLEASYTATVEKLYEDGPRAFQGLSLQVLAFDATLEDTTENAAQKAENQRIAANLQALAQSMTANDIVDFYSYYVTRGLYAQLGTTGYMQSYKAFEPFIQQCIDSGLNCPTHPDDLNSTLAARDLLRHADNTFSSVTTAGAPFPFWSQGDGTGILFLPNSQTGGFFPVSGSGIDMSGDMLSLGGYLVNSGGAADPTSEAWQTEVEVNPLYAWFMASLAPADPATVCGNGDLTGNPLVPESGPLLAAQTPRWCTQFDVPNPSNPGTETSYTKQYFARMWYDLLISSDGFLGVTQGQDDPYSWTTGAGCDYELGQSRYSFTGQSTEEILSNSSRLVYNIDEGVTLGPIDRHLILGGVTPPIGEYDYENPIQEVRVLQNLYGSLLPLDIMNRLKNCNRPGGPIELTKDEATELLEQWKEAMENTWTQGWDDKNDGPVQFVAFFDDGGATVGSTGRMLTQITLDNTTLTMISIFIIAFFSAMFLFSFDFVESRVLITMVGVALVVLSFFSALGFGILTGVKINVTIAWTLPFVIIGLGVDDVYIILLALKKQNGYTLKHWLNAMHEIVIPVTMTSLVNASMFAILNISDIPAIYLTSRVAMYCVIALYLSVIFCFPAYCYFDLLRQQNNRIDFFFCRKSSVPARDNTERQDFRNVILYENFYKPIVLNGGKLRYLFHAVIVVLSCALFAVGCYGTTERAVGLGLADFFPDDNPAGRWAKIGQEVMASWAIVMNWGAIDYKDGETQMRMIKQFEDVVGNPRVGETDTKQLWMADFLIWTSRHCEDDFGRPNFDQHLCGRFQLHEETGTYCAGSWTENTYGLRSKNIASIFDTTCVANEGGICRLGEQMHLADLAEIGFTPETASGRQFCPVTDGWGDAKFEFCVNKWRSLTGGGGRLLTRPGTGSPEKCANNDAEIVYPIPFSNGPTMYAYDVFTHEETLEMMTTTREYCDDVEDVHCWLSGIPCEYGSELGCCNNDVCVYSHLLCHP